MRVIGQLTVRLLLLGSLLSACAPIHFTSQDVILKHDQDHDVLDMLILYNEVESGDRGPGDAHGDETGKFADRLILGKREFMLFDWPLHLDLDAIAVGLDEKEPWAAWQREAVGLLDGISVEHSGVYRSDRGRLSLFQRFRIKNASHWITLFDTSLRLWIEESVREGTFEQDTPYLDARTRELWADLAKQKRRWLTLQAGVLRVELPMTSHVAAGLLVELMKQCGGNNRAGTLILGCLAAPITDLSVSGETTRITWGTSGTPLAFRYEVEGEYDQSFSKSLEESGDLPKKLSSRDELIARFRAQ
jgi:hypothetical protein